MRAGGGEPAGRGEGAIPFAGLEREQYIALTTFRRSGEAVVTPVWFAVEDGRVYVRTAADSGKVKRIRRNPRVRLVPSTWNGKPRGRSVEAAVRILPPEESDRANLALARKYGWKRRIIDTLARIRPSVVVFLEIVPA